MPLNVVALIVGQPHAVELWTLKHLAGETTSLRVIQAESGSGVGARKRLRRLVRDHGAAAVASRVIAGKFIGAFHERRQARQLEQLFDGQQLREWWSQSGIKASIVPHLNHKDAVSAIDACRPDVIVRVSGGLLKRPTFECARLAAINIHHGIAPRIRGMWSIPWAIVEGRRDWIGATVHEIDDGIDTGRVLWRGSPQVAPGDTATTLFFRAHLEAVEALVGLMRVYSEGNRPPGWTGGRIESSTYRSAPGLGAWMRFLYASEGKTSRTVLEGALKC
jgi:hypothetical protein